MDHDLDNIGNFLESLKVGRRFDDTLPDLGGVRFGIELVDLATELRPEQPDRKPIGFELDKNQFLGETQVPIHMDVELVPRVPGQSAL